MRTVLAHQYSIVIDHTVVVQFLAPAVVEQRKLLLLSFVPTETKKVGKVAGALGCPEAELAGDRLGEEGRGHHVAAQRLICIRWSPPRRGT